jgi:hypothetical protein
LRIREEMLMAWEAKPEVQSLQQEFLDSHKAWRKLRKIEPLYGDFPGIRLVLLHSLSHALMRQIVLDCGYTAASVRDASTPANRASLAAPWRAFFSTPRHPIVKERSADWWNWVIH